LTITKTLTKTTNCTFISKNKWRGTTRKIFSGALCQAGTRHFHNSFWRHWEHRHGVDWVEMSASLFQRLILKLMQIRWGWRGMGSVRFVAWLACRFLIIVSIWPSNNFHIRVKLALDGEYNCQSTRHLTFVTSYDTFSRIEMCRKCLVFREFSKYGDWGKFSASVWHRIAEMFSASGGFSPKLLSRGCAPGPHRGLHPTIPTTPSVSTLHHTFFWPGDTPAKIRHSLITKVLQTEII